MLYIFLELILIALTSSLDAFVACFGYGLNKIKIPFKTACFMTLISTLTMSTSLIIGFLFKEIIPLNICRWISFSLLLITGIIKLFSDIFKIILTKTAKKTIKIKFFNFNLLINVLNNPENADIDKNKILSLKEALSLSFILSLDEFGVGISLGLKNVLNFIIIPLNIVFSLFSIFFGIFIGKNMSKIIKINFSWLSGIILIGLAIVKLFV